MPGQIREQEIINGNYKLVVKDIKPFMRINVRKRFDADFDYDADPEIRVGLKATIEVWRGDCILERRYMRYSKPVDTWERTQEDVGADVDEAIKYAEGVIEDDINKYKAFVANLVFVEQKLRERYGDVEVDIV